MSELSFEQMFEESSFKRLRTGEAVTGQVIGVKEDEIILSIAGSKSEGTNASESTLSLREPLFKLCYSGFTDKYFFFDS